jgi:hypothetical protein
MDSEQLLAVSRQVRQHADALLQEAGLIAHLQNYGEVLFTGSYAIDLMLNRDIDLYVVSPELAEERVLDALRSLILQSFFHGYLYYDSLKHPKVGFPSGYYIGLKLPFRDEKWKVDIWFLGADLESRMQQIQEINALDEGKRLAILRFKHLVIERQLKISGMFIYDVVLRRGITDEQAFLEEIAGWS